MNDPILIATRGSALALAQANAVLAQCRAAFPSLRFELKIIKTTGDKLQTASLAQEGQALPKGLFTKELEVALLRGEADIAVHSLKDLPTELPDGLKLGAVGRRADVRDVMIYRATPVTGGAPTSPRGFPPGLRVADLPSGAVVASSSTRRKATSQRSTAKRTKASHKALRQTASNSCITRSHKTSSQRSADTGNKAKQRTAKHRQHRAKEACFGKPRVRVNRQRTACGAGQTLQCVNFTRRHMDEHRILATALTLKLLRQRIIVHAQPLRSGEAPGSARYLRTKNRLLRSSLRVTCHRWLSHSLHVISSERILVLPLN